MASTAAEQQRGMMNSSSKRPRRSCAGQGMERLTYDALGEECQHRRKSVIDLVGDGSPRNKGASPRRKKKAKNVVYSEEGNEENVPRNAEVLKQVDTTIAYEPDSLWRIGTIVVAKSKTFNKKLRGHIIMHIRGGITTHYAIQKVRVLFDQRQGDKTYEDIDVSTAEAAASALSTVDGVPRVAVRMWTSGTPCMRRDALDYAARIPDASDKERGFGVSAKLSKSSIKSGFAGNANQSRGLNKAEIKAQAALAAGRCTDASVLEALTELGDDWPQQDRPNVSSDGKPVRGMMLGAVFVLGGIGMAVSNVSDNFPNLTKLVTSWVRASLPSAGFPFSSIQVNYCYAAKKHVDANNLGPSLGKHTGGALWIADRYTFDDAIDPNTGLAMIRGGGGAGTLDARTGWALFDGNAEHYTMPYSGTRISFVVFSHHAYNKLPKHVVQRLLDLGFTAASSDYIELDYFRRFRVDKKEFDADENSVYFRFQARRARELPPPALPNRIAVECYGLTMARGGGWISFAGNDNVPTVIELTPNMTGFHVIELCFDRDVGLIEVSRHVDRKRFNIYGRTDAETKRFVTWVNRMPKGHVVVVGISDTAVAAKRPPGESLYDALRTLGAPKHIERIGYRFPFTFVGVKGSAQGDAAILMGKTKHLLRIETTITRDSNGDVVLSKTTNETTDITSSVILPQT